MGSGVSAIEQTMIVAASTFHFGRQTRLPTQGQTRVRNASPAVARNKRCVFQDDLAIDFVDGAHPKGTQPKIVKFYLYT